MFISRSTFSVRKDRVDSRDYKFNFVSQEEPRQSVDLRVWCSPVEDQLHLGSCVGQAIVGAFELTINKLYPDKFIDLSRLFVYYNARLLDGYVNEDVGAYVRDGIKAVNKWGVCAEDIWPYIVDRFASPPSIISYQDAQKRLITKYYRINSVENMVSAMNLNYPVVISMNVYDSFYDVGPARNYVLSNPAAVENLIGGHAVTLVGYDLNKKLLLARNSFGEGWGDNGYFWVPFEYAAQDFMDCWIFDADLK